MKWTEILNFDRINDKKEHFKIDLPLSDVLKWGASRAPEE